MIKSLIKGGLVGGIVVFAWMIASRLFIPWHATTMHSFANEVEVASVVKKNAPKEGVYIYPSDAKGSESLEHSGQPLIYMSVDYSGAKIMQPWNFVYYFLCQVLGGVLLSALLLFAARSHYFCKLVFATVYGFAIGAMAYFPLWIWMRVDTCYIWVQIADLTIGWCIAGLFLAAMITKRCGKCPQNHDAA